MEIETKRRMQILLEKLVIIEDKLGEPDRLLDQIEQEMDTTIEDGDSDEDSSGSSVSAENVYQAGDYLFLFLMWWETSHLYGQDIIYSFLFYW